MNAGRQLIFREIDLLGDIVRETNVRAVSEQLVAMGKQPITGEQNGQCLRRTSLPKGRASPAQAVTSAATSLLRT